MEDGTRVTIGSGDTVYQAYKTRGEYTWNSYYTLVPELGGRKRYNVRASQVRAYVPMPGLPIVRTSVGSVRRPRTFRKFTKLSGSCRTTYLGKNWVFKIQHIHTEIWNAREAARYQLQSGTSYEEVEQRFGYQASREASVTYRDVPVAECYLLPDNVLMMERVRPVYNICCGEKGAEQLSREELKNLGFQESAWMLKVDSEQIGYDRHDRVVAYDL